MNRHNRSDKPDWVPPRSIKLLDQVRERVRYLHYSLQTEKAYVYWAKAFVLWTARSHGGFRHLREMGQTEVEGFLTMLATEKQVAPATHRQALNALLFLYRQVLGMELPWMQQIGRPPERKRIPVVLAVQEVQTLLSHMGGIRTGQELLEHSDASTTMIYTYVLKVAAGGTASPLDEMVFAN